MNRIHCLESSDNSISEMHIQDVTECFTKSKRRNLDVEDAYAPENDDSPNTEENENSPNAPEDDSSANTPSGDADLPIDTSSSESYEPSYYPTTNSSSGDDSDNEEIEIIL